MIVGMDLTSLYMYFTISPAWSTGGRARGGRRDRARSKEVTG